MNAPDWVEECEWENLDVVRDFIGRASWVIRDIDPMASGEAYVFYLRSQKTHDYSNVLKHKMDGFQFDYSVMVPAEVVRNHPDKAAEYIVWKCNDALESAQSKPV